MIDSWKKDAVHDLFAGSDRRIRHDRAEVCFFDIFINAWFVNRNVFNCVFCRIFLASSNASSLTSTISTMASGFFFASESPIGPYPQPTSKILSPSSRPPAASIKTRDPKSIVFFEKTPLSVTNLKSNPKSLKSKFFSSCLTSGFLNNNNFLSCSSCLFEFRLQVYESNGVIISKEDFQSLMRIKSPLCPELFKVPSLCDALDRNRTDDLPLRRRLLYPAELRAHLKKLPSTATSLV